MQRLLALPKRSTAVFAANDIMALAAMLAVQEAGLTVPQDMGVGLMIFLPHGWSTCR